MKDKLKALLERVLPARIFHRILSVRSRRFQMQFIKSLGLFDQVKGYIDEHGTTVQSGPFSGLVYPLEAAVSRWSVPKLVGSYEQELHALLYTAAKRMYDCVIDIGSAEGYYAVGLARMLQIPVLAYETEPQEKRFTTLMAERNGVSHLVQVQGLFTIGEMRRLATRRALVICDCEGFEEALFRRDTLNLTRNWDLLIELHGSADVKLPSLPWSQATSIVGLSLRSGPQNEYRAQTQRFLWCDSECCDSEGSQVG